MLFAKLQRTERKKKYHKKNWVLRYKWVVVEGGGMRRLQGRGDVRTERQMCLMPSDCDRDQKGVKNTSA